MVAPTTLCTHDKTSLGAPNRRFALPQADWHLSLGAGHNEYLLHHRCGGRDHSRRRFLGSAGIGKAASLARWRSLRDATRARGIELRGKWRCHQLASVAQGFQPHLIRGSLGQRYHQTASHPAVGFRPRRRWSVAPEFVSQWCLSSSAGKRSARRWSAKDRFGRDLDPIGYRGAIVLRLVDGGRNRPPHLLGREPTH
jgi:hypothetical protein